MTNIKEDAEPLFVPPILENMEDIRLAIAKYGYWDVNWLKPSLREKFLNLTNEIGIR